MKKSLLILIFLAPLVTLSAQSDMNNYYDGIEFRKEFEVSPAQFKKIRAINDECDTLYEEIGLDTGLTAAQKIRHRRNLLRWRKNTLERVLTPAQKATWQYRQYKDFNKDDLEVERLDYLDSREVDVESHYSNEKVKLEYLYDENYISKAEYKKLSEKLKKEYEKEMERKQRDKKSIKNKQVYRKPLKK